MHKFGLFLLTGLILAIVLPAPASAADSTAGALPLSEQQTGPMITLLQDRLGWLGYPIDKGDYGASLFGTSTTGNVKDFQTKFFINPTGVVDGPTWIELRRLSEPRGELPITCTEVTSICISLEQKILRYVVGGKVQMSADARFGVSGQRTSPGSYQVYWKSRDHVSSRFQTPMPFSLFYDGDQAVHYSPYFQADGYLGGSHGCVNLRDLNKAAWLFKKAGRGTRIYIY